MQTFKKPLTPNEEALYIKQCKAGNQTARNILIEYNLRLVAHIAKNMQEHVGNATTSCLQEQSD